MKRRRNYYIDPLWLAFLLVGISVGLLLSGLQKPAEAKEVVVVREVPVERTVYVEAANEPEEPVVAAPVKVSMGTFKITAYCPCEKCCGAWADGITATGTTATQGRTIAVDPSVIPYGSVVYFEGPDGLVSGYVAEDCGGAIKGNRIDLYFDSHQDALEWGVRELEVFSVEVQ